MTLDEFQVLSGPDQLAAVYATGTFVSRRCQEVDEAGRWYRMPGGFFAELTDNTTRQQVLYPGSFGADVPDKREIYALSTPTVCVWARSESRQAGRYASSL